MATFLMKKLPYDITLANAVSKEMNNNPQTDESGSWTDATSSQVTTEMDPNTYSGSEVYAFARLSFVNNVDMDVVAAKLTGKGTLDGTQQAFYDGCKANNVNVYYLVGQALIESGNGTSELAQGVMWQGKKVYNFFGIGAVDSNPLNGGAQYAYNHGWTTPELAIIGGAQFVSHDYINNSPRQDTVYKYRYNIEGGQTHQYATDIRYPRKNSVQIASFMDDLDITVQLDVPEYSDNPITLDISEGEVENGDDGGEYNPDNPDDNTTIDTKLQGNVFYLKNNFLYQLGTSLKFKRYNDHFYPCDSDTTEDDINNNGGGASDVGSGDGYDLEVVMKVAEQSWAGYYYANVRPQPPLTSVKYADCSSWVGWCLKDIYPKCWNGGSLNTYTIWKYFSDYIEYEGDYGGLISFPKQRGDIISFASSNNGFIAGPTSHVGIMLDETNVRAMGSSGVKTYDLSVLASDTRWSYFGVQRPKY